MCECRTISWSMAKIYQWIHPHKMVLFFPAAIHIHCQRLLSEGWDLEIIYPIYIGVDLGFCDHMQVTAASVSSWVWLPCLRQRKASTALLPTRQLFLCLSGVVCVDIAVQCRAKYSVSCLSTLVLHVSIDCCPLQKEARVGVNINILKAIWQHNCQNKNSRFYTWACDLPSHSFWPGLSARHEISSVRGGLRSNLKVLDFPLKVVPLPGSGGAHL